MRALLSLSTNQGQDKESLYAKFYKLSLSEPQENQANKNY